MHLSPKPLRRFPTLPLFYWVLTLCGLVFLFGTRTAFGNNPGGFVSTVTTAVTTGTEVFNGLTDRYMDNGILHVIITSNGDVASIHFLAPGSPGRPETSGTEMVSQSGVNLGNHTVIYYYWYPDGNGNATYLSTTTVGTSVDMAFKSTFNSAVLTVPVDMEIHYVLGKGNTGLYVYMVAIHPSSYSTYGNASISFMQMIWPGPHTATSLLCENQYLDNVYYGLYLSGTQQARNGLQPTFVDNYSAVNVAGYPKEIFQYTTGLFSGQLNGKYSYTFDYPTVGTWGMASDVNPIGLWVVAGDHAYQNNGPTACEYAGGYTGVLLFEPLIAHYDNTGLTVSGTANWTKVYGPWLLYFNSVTTGTAAWKDAKNQVIAEAAAVPYSWLSNSAYQPKAQRATVTGKLVINDALRPGSSAAGAWVGLAQPDSGIENDPGDWQFQSDEYQYWTQAAADGSFTIPNVQTFSPYGGSASYELYAYSSGTSPSTGSVGQYQTGPIAIASGSTTNLGTLTWNVPHLGQQLVWEIGIPNRSATEFKHGNEYGRPGMWSNFINEFTNPLEYDVADNNWATALNYCHSVDNMATAPWKWHLNFNLSSVTEGTYWLNIAYASPCSVQIIRVNDDSSIFADFTPANADPGATTYIREGIHSKYSVAHVAIPWSSLQVGANTITLDHEYHSDHGDAHFMYDYIDLEAPAPVVLPPGRNLVWKGGVNSNTWDNASTNWIVSGSATPAVAYTDGDRPTFDDTGSTSPSIELTGTLTPGELILGNSTHNYTFAGPGTLVGPMQLFKTGSGNLTISPTQATVTGTLTSGSAGIMVPTVNLGVGMSVAGTGIPASTIVTSINGSGAMSLSQAATVTGTESLSFTAANSFYGGSDISKGTVIFSDDTANAYGLGTGPVTLDGGTLQMYNNEADYDSESWNINIPAGSTGNINADSRIDMHGTVTGGGTLNLYVPWIRTTLWGNWGNFLGQLNVTTNTSTGGDFRMANSNGYPNASINLGPKVNMYSNLNAAGTYSVGALTGDATATLEGINYNGATPGAYTNLWSVGGLNMSGTFAGYIVNGTSPSITGIIKVGYGTWTLSGTCSYTGPTDVEGGTLSFTGSAAGCTGLTVEANGTLEVANGSLSVNGPITNIGTVRLKGSGTLQTTGTFTNYGVVDVITGSQGLPANFVNQGIVVNLSAAEAQQIATSSTGQQLSIYAYAGHNYQLQRSAAFTSGSGTWVNVGSAQAGNNGTLTFSDSAAPGKAGFYRFTISP
jgi:rhamnogalacturonan endolyase